MLIFKWKKFFFAIAWTGGEIFDNYFRQKNLKHIQTIFNLYSILTLRLPEWNELPFFSGKTLFSIQYWSRLQERTISLRFLSIILRVQTWGFCMDFLNHREDDMVSMVSIRFSSFGTVVRPTPIFRHPFFSENSVFL